MRYRGVSVAATIAALLVSLLATTGSGQSAAGAERRFTPGSAGAGDPYFPLDGNGGYDVKHYDVDVSYNPTSEHLSGTATIAAQATQNLSRFNFDFDGLHVQSIRVAGHPATWTRQSGELVVTPSHGIVSGHGFTTVVTYQGTPREFQDPGVGTVGFVRTERRRRRGRRAARCLDLVPGQRPPHRQGLLLLPHHRARRVCRRSRTAGWPRSPTRSRLDHVELDRLRAHGHLPRDDGDRPLRHPPLPGQRPGSSGMPSTPSSTNPATTRVRGPGPATPGPTRFSNRVRRSSG